MIAERRVNDTDLVREQAFIAAVALEITSNPNRVLSIVIGGQGMTKPANITGLFDEWRAASRSVATASLRRPSRSRAIPRRNAPNGKWVGAPHWVPLEPLCSACPKASA